MLIDDLFNGVLLKPAIENEADELLILSGYATAPILSHHMVELKKAGCKIKIELIVGMTPVDGVDYAQHNLFKDFQSKRFKCRYIKKSQPECHAKIYIWLRGGHAFAAYCGSANYTWKGFMGERRKEVLAPVDVTVAVSYYERIKKMSVSCTSSDAKKVVRYIPPIEKDQVAELDSVLLSLIDKRTGKTHTRAGMNWGQRPKRNPNQAYIPIPAKHKNYFPDLGIPFTVRTDDDEVFIMVKAQMQGKALHTPEDNSKLGEYIRKRLGLKSGEYVKTEHLKLYGRNNIKFTKIDDDFYEMDFSPPKKT